MDPHHIDADPDADPDSTHQPDGDSNFLLDADLDFYLMPMRFRLLLRICMIRIHNTASKYSKVRYWYLLLLSEKNIVWRTGIVVFFVLAIIPVICCFINPPTGWGKKLGNSDVWRKSCKYIVVS